MAQIQQLYSIISQSLLKNSEDGLDQISSAGDILAVTVHSIAVQSGLEYQNPSESLPSNWNSGSPNYYSFKYKSRSVPIEITIAKAGSQSYTITAVDDHSNHSSIVVQVSSFISSDHNNAESVKDFFISDDATNDFAENVTSKVIRSTVDHEPDQGSSKDSGTTQGLEQPTTTSRLLESSERVPTTTQPPPPQELPEPAVPRPSNPALRPDSDTFLPLPGPRPRPPIPVGGDVPPGFDDEYEIEGRLSDRLREPGTGSNRPYLPIGEGDLNPPGIGRYPPMRPSIGIGGGLGVGPRPGMYPSLDDPFFQGQEEGNPGDLSRPPGARWDPTGPPKGPGFGRGAGGFGNFGSGGSGGFGGPGGFI